MDVFKSLGKILLFFFILILITYFYQGTDKYKANQIQEYKESKIRETPHIIRSVDDCTVYEFEKDGKNHFFTRCKSTTSTTRNYRDHCSLGGKAMCERSEEIVTENKN
jgi:HJR/Mrr/RecB family endonuclease